MALSLVLFTLATLGLRAQTAPPILSLEVDRQNTRGSETVEKQAATDETSDQRRHEHELLLRQEEHQRILGFLPNFNTTNDAAWTGPLSPGQKIRLAAKTAFDPFTFAVAGVDAAIGQGEDSFDEYGLGAQGYGKRLGAAYADSVDGTMIGNAFLPILFHQDPRYFRKGTGSFTSRLLYSMSTTVRARNDAGRWVPNYSNVLGNIAAGGIANVYYPASDRGVGLTFQRAFTVTAEGTIGAFLVEFWPDISHHLFKKTWAAKQAAMGNP